MAQRILITGGAGFLGRHLCRSMAAAGHSVRVIDLHQNPEFETTIANIQDKDRMKQEIWDVDAVFHLAASIEAGESVQNPQKFIDNNISGSLSVLEAMRENGVRKVFMSSTAAVYGEPQSVPITEDMTTMPINPYGMTKLAMEALISSYVQSHGFTGVALRYFNLYGTEEHHQPETHAIPRFIEQIYNDQPVTIYGQGQHLRDYIYVQDVVNAHLKALDLADREPEQYHFCNLSTEKPASVIEVVRMLENIMGKTANIEFQAERPGDPLKLYASAAKAHQLLGWQAETELEAGLRQVVEYFQKYWQQ